MVRSETAYIAANRGSGVQIPFAIPHIHVRQTRAGPRVRRPCPTSGWGSTQQRSGSQFFAVTVSRWFSVAVGVVSCLRSWYQLLLSPVLVLPMEQPTSDSPWLQPALTYARYCVTKSSCQARSENVGDSICDPQAFPQSTS
eukprot:2901388-Rhodomonas_salina.4